MYEMKQKNNIQRDYHRELQEDEHGNEKNVPRPYLQKYSSHNCWYRSVHIFMINCLYAWCLTALSAQIGYTVP